MIPDYAGLALPAQFFMHKNNRQTRSTHMLLTDCDSGGANCHEHNPMQGVAFGTRYPIEPMADRRILASMHGVLPAHRPAQNVRRHPR